MCGEEKPLDSFRVTRRGEKQFVRLECRQCEHAQNKAWREANKAHLREYDIARATPERRQKTLEWQRANRHMTGATCMKRRAAKLQATPPWLDPKACDWAYVVAKVFEGTYGGKWHVDHIVPLQGKNVCGLHVPWNLRVCPASENLKKSNSHEW